MLAVLFQDVFDFYVRSVVLYKKMYQGGQGMEYICKVLELKDGRSVRFEFSESSEMFSEEQINDIIEVVKEYLLHFPQLSICIVTDYENDRYQNVDKDDKYDGQAFYVDKAIVLNQIKFASKQFEDKIGLSAIEKYSKEILNLSIKIQELPKIMTQEDADTYIAAIMSQINWKKKELNGKTFDNVFANSWAVRSFEEVMCIKRVLIHEIAHLVANQYQLLSKDLLKCTFENYKEQFENIDEFFAECFMTSEFTKAVPIANWIKVFVNRNTDRKV